MYFKVVLIIPNTSKRNYTWKTPSCQKVVFLIRTSKTPMDPRRTTHNAPSNLVMKETKMKTNINFNMKNQNENQTSKLAMDTRRTTHNAPSNLVTKETKMKININFNNMKNRSENPKIKIEKHICCKLLILCLCLEHIICPFLALIIFLSNMYARMLNNVCLHMRI